MNVDYVNHIYSDLQGLYSDEEYDEVRPAEPDNIEEVEYDDSLPAPTGSDRPPCSICKEPNFSLRDSRCISCRIAIR
jgi:hypothetical protein